MFPLSLAKGMCVLGFYYLARIVPLVKVDSSTLSFQTKFHFTGLERCQHGVEQIGIWQHRGHSNATPKIVEARCPHVQQVSSSFVLHYFSYYSIRGIVIMANGCGLSIQSI